MLICPDPLTPTLCRKRERGRHELLHDPRPHTGEEGPAQGEGTGEARRAVDVARPQLLRAASRLWLFLGGLNGALRWPPAPTGGRRAGAAGREMFGIASNYQVAHGLGLLAVAWLASRQKAAG